MAYKKKAIEPETSNTENTEVIKTKVNEVPIETVTEELNVEGLQTKVAIGVSKKEPEIPDFALGLLKVFNDYPTLYINEKGCIYTSQPPVNMGAILYKNPFYKH